MTHPFRMFFLERWFDGPIALRSGFDEEDVYTDAESDDSSSRSVGRSYGGGNNANKVVVRKDFPETWTFDGNLNLGYSKIFFRLLII